MNNNVIIIINLQCLQQHTKRCHVTVTTSSLCISNCYFNFDSRFNANRCLDTRL